MFLLALPLLSRLGRVIIDVEARTLQDERGGSQDAADAASAAEAAFERWLGDSLSDFEAPPASGAFILVSRHGVKRT